MVLHKNNYTNSFYMIYKLLQRILLFRLFLDERQKKKDRRKQKMKRPGNKKAGANTLRLYRFVGLRGQHARP